MRAASVSLKNCVVAVLCSLSIGRGTTEMGSLISRGDDGVLEEQRPNGRAELPESRRSPSL